mgnify:CR=1 FL=1
MFAAVNEHNQRVRIVPLKPDPFAFFGPDGQQPGYLVPLHVDNVVEDCEYLGMYLASGMYEMGVRYQDFENWSWAVIPESAAEVRHLDDVGIN